MHIPVLIESMPGNGYRARGGEPFAIVGEGDTPEDALAQFKDRVADKLRSGARVATIEIEPREHPWRRFGGMFQESDPLIRQWLDTMRRERDTDEESE